MERVDEAVRRLIHLLKLRKVFKAGDTKGMSREMGNYEEWYIDPKSKKTSEKSRAAVSRLLAELEGKAK